MGSLTWQCFFSLFGARVIQELEWDLAQQFAIHLPMHALSARILKRTDVFPPISVDSS